MTRGMLIAGAAALALLAGCGKKPEVAADEAKSAQAGPTATPATAPAPAAPMTPPSRKAGLWTQTISTGGRTQTSSICFDAALDRKMAFWGQQVTEHPCEQKSIAPTAGGWKFSSTCDLGASGKVVSTGEAKGDFGAHYTVTMDSTTTGASMPQMNGAHHMEIAGDWKGPCPADMKPGDMTLPGGMKINMLTMAASMPKRP